MIVWITGAHGFIGRHLSRQLAASGHFVAGLGHGSWPESECRNWGLHYWLNADVDAANLNRLLVKTGVPEVIFHLAGGSSVGQSYASPAEDFGRTVITTACLLDWVWQAATDSRVVMVSSAAVYGSGHAGAIEEDSVLTPFSPYGHHKAMAEQLCRSYVESCGVSASVVRLFSVYGAGLQKQLLWDICSRLARDDKKLQLGGTGHELRDWLYVTDAVRLLDQIGQQSAEPFSIVNGGTGIATSIEDIATMVIAAWGGDTQLLFSGQGRVGDPQSLVADTSKLQTIGFAPAVSLDEGIAKTVAWFKRNHLS